MEHNESVVGAVSLSGKLHVEVFDSEFPGKCLKGQRNLSRRFVWQ